MDQHINFITLGWPIFMFPVVFIGMFSVGNQTKAAMSILRFIKRVVRCFLRCSASILWQKMRG